MADHIYVSRAGEKLAFALDHFNLDVSGLICADLGCSTGGFTDCLIQHRASKVYAVDTGYGVLDYKLRTNPKVIVLERHNALHLKLPELVDFVSVDVGWTPQRLILPAAAALTKPGSHLISLIKPHYEAHLAYLDLNQSQEILNRVLSEISQTVPSLKYVDSVVSPIVGLKGGNHEFLVHFSQPNHWTRV